MAENSAVKIGMKKVEYSTKPLQRDRKTVENRAVFAHSYRLSIETNG